MMTHSTPTMLATDLDGTFLPLSHEDAYASALQQIGEAFAAPSDRSLIYVTGRHLESAQEAMKEHALPSPDGMFCDVGTTFYEPGNRGWAPSPAYRSYMSDCAEGVERSTIQELFADIHGLRLQEQEKQGRFKISYYCPAGEVTALVQRMTDRLTRREIPYSLIGSVDPFTDTGLIDALPRGVSKAAALEWLIRENGLTHNEVIFAGDSGNDLAVFLSGIPSIVVGNAKPQVVEDVKRALADGAEGTVYFSRAAATCGVLEGLQHYGLL